MEDTEIIAPSSPKQQLMLCQSADTAILGGAMGSGKSYISLLYPLKFANDPHFRGIIFRRTLGEITAQTGLWENACEIYDKVFGKDKNGKQRIKIQQKNLKITFPSGGSLKFSFLESSKDLLLHQGAAYTFVLFDEATHFSQEMVEYLIKRMRSARATHQKQMVLTCNPDPDWFGVEWIKPYLTEDGTPDSTKDGLLRYYVVDGGEYIWSDNREELEKIYGSGPDSGIRSFTFVSANCMDNIPLMKADPSYLSNLKAQPYVDVQRYLYGNWFVRPTNSGMVRKEFFIEEDNDPPWTEVVRTVRSFDFAGTLKSDSNTSPDYTATVCMSLLKDGTYFIHDVRRTRIRVGDWKKFIIECAAFDRPRTEYVLPIDPNPAAKAATMMLARELIVEAGLVVKTMKASGRKVDRFRPFASMCQNGGIKIKKDCGQDFENNAFNTLKFFYSEVERFDGQRRSGEAGHDDVCDCLSDSFSMLAQQKVRPNLSLGMNSTSFTKSSSLPF